MIPVLVLNLPRDAERHRWMDTHLRSLGIPYVLIHGVDGRSMPEHEAAPHMARFRKAYGRDMTRGELGCALAHLRLIRRIAMGPDPLVCVLEDDIEISPHAKAFLKEATLRSLPAFDVLRLYSNDHRQRKTAWRIATMNECSIVAPLRTGWGMYAQVYTRAGAQKVADQQIRAPIDGMIYYDCPPLGLRILEVRPSLVCLRDFGSSTVGWQKPRGIAQAIFALKALQRQLRAWLHFVATWGLRGVIGLIRSPYRQVETGVKEPLAVAPVPQRRIAPQPTRWKTRSQTAPGSEEN